MVSRRVGRRLQVAASGTARLIFGPFNEGERLLGFIVYLESVTPTAGDQIIVEIKAFAQEIADTAAIFAAMGRSLTGAGTAASQPRLPIGERTFSLPVGFVATEDERFVGIQVTEQAADDLDGSVWAITDYGSLVVLAGAPPVRGLRT